LEVLYAEMPKPSALQQFLNKFSPERKHELERQIRSAPDAKTAYSELKRIGYRRSYDTVLNWRSNQAKGRADHIQRSAEVVSSAASASALNVDPVESCMNLAIQLNTLCSSLTTLLQAHQWLEPGELRLSSGQAVKILTALPSLNRAASSTILEMSRIRVGIDEKALCLATIEELRKDWQQTLEADNPELIGVFEDVARVTRARLEIDSESLLERALDRSSTIK
jgi:hypothetical protein